MVTAADNKLFEHDNYIEFYLDFQNLSNRFQGVNLDRNDRPKVNVKTDWDIQGKYDGGKTLFLSLFFDNDDIYYTENFVASTAVEQLFMLWPPKYAWLDGADTIYDPERELPWIFQQSMLDTPWQHYNHSMVFGPELVKNLGLKELNWQCKDIFFSKWVTENILWLASPFGIRSEVKRFENEDEAAKITQKHYLALKERLNLHPLRSLETKEWKDPHPFVPPLENKTST